VKWFTLLIVSVLITQTTAAQMLIPVEGSSSSGQTICPSYPWWIGSSLGGGCNGAGLALENPQNGSTFFYTVIGSPTVNLTVDVYGGTPSSCQYQFMGFGWNSFSVCGGPGINSSWVNAVTLPEGYPDTINVSMVICGQVVSNVTQFTVYGQPGTVKHNIYVFAAIVIFMLLLWKWRRRKRRLVEVPFTLGRVVNYATET
jgi:hypothetical protein